LRASKNKKVVCTLAHGFVDVNFTGMPSIGFCFDPLSDTSSIPYKPMSGAGDARMIGIDNKQEKGYYP